MTNVSMIVDKLSTFVLLSFLNVWIGVDMMRKSKLSKSEQQERLQTILDMTADGRSQRKIARKLGISNTYVGILLKKHEAEQAAISDDK